jgi:hypothetical protein
MRMSKLFVSLVLRIGVALGNSLKKDAIPETMAWRMDAMPLTMAISTEPMVRHKDWI